MDVSVCIVNLNAKQHLASCLNLLPESLGSYSYEVIIVDNHSQDGSQEFIQQEYPGFHLLINHRNEGYTQAINSAIRVSRGDYLAVLNPDSEPGPNSIFTLIEFLKMNENIGIVGPKVIASDGSFQRSCRRGVARPAAVFSYFLGLARRYPNDQRFTGYHLNHLDENEINEVSGVSGSCMVIRRKILKDIGYFDEQFFAYQEDSDYCLRAKERGWKVYYNPHSIVKHRGGMGGANSVPMKAIFEWHRSYYKYYFKHFADDYSMIFNIFYSIAMVGKLIFAEGKYLIKQ